MAFAQEIWRPPTNATWQWQLQFNVNTSFDVDMYDVDLFDVETATFDEIKAKGSAVMCYFSAGTRESWRDDADDFPAAALGEALGDWEGEVWVDVNNEAVREIMAARIALAAVKGCDGVEPDNVQVYAEAIWGIHTGVSVTADEQLDYNLLLAAEGYSTSFIAAGKAVFHAEYEKKNLTFCEQANAMGMSSILKAYDLGPARCSCQDRSTNYQCDLLLEEGISSYSSTSSSISTTGTDTGAPNAAPTASPTVSPSEDIDGEASDDSSARSGETYSWAALAAGGAAAAVGSVLL
eukprot:g7449.t1